MYLKPNLIFLLVIGFFNSAFSQDKHFKNDRKTISTSDWVRFNIEAGVAYSKSFSVIPIRLNDSDRHGNGNVYSRNSASDTDRFSPYAALNFILGKNEVKYLVGVSYLNVKTNYDHSTGSGFTPSYGSASPPFYAQSTTVSVSGNYHILSLNNGLNFKVGKGLNLCIIGSIGVAAKGTLVSNGYRVDYTTVADTVYPGTKTISQTTIIENEKSNGNSVSFFSVQAKVYYDFKIKENVLGVYLLGNISAINRLPYCTVGLSWYPFKRFRATDL